jgi:hypothetical protein
VPVSRIDHCQFRWSRDHLCIPLDSSSVAPLLVSCKLVKDLVVSHLYTTPKIKTFEQFSRFMTLPPISSYFHISDITWSGKYASNADIRPLCAQLGKRMESWLEEITAEQAKIGVISCEAKQLDKYHHWYERGIHFRSRHGSPDHQVHLRCV